MAGSTQPSFSAQAFHFRVSETPARWKEAKASGLDDIVRNRERAQSEMIPKASVTNQNGRASSVLSYDQWY
jgi:NADH:ubiquinone oxidoreductase subunit